MSAPHTLAVADSSTKRWSLHCLKHCYVNSTDTCPRPLMSSHDMELMANCLLNAPICEVFEGPEDLKEDKIDLQSVPERNVPL